MARNPKKTTTIATTSSSATSGRSRPFDEYSDATKSQPAIFLAPTTRKAGPSQNLDRTLVEADPEEGIKVSSTMESSQDPEPKPPPKRSKTIWTVLLIVFIVGAVAAAVAAILLVRRDQRGSSSKASLSNASANSADLAVPTVSPTFTPSPTLSTAPSDGPSSEPTVAPTRSPSAAPTATPSASPTADPTRSPSAAPTATPSASPTPDPSSAPSSAPTVSPAPTASPSAAPTKDYVSMMQAMLFANYAVDFSSTALSNILAVEWLAVEAAAGKLPADEKLVQRFALLSMDFSLQDAKHLETLPLFAKKGVDECDWEGVHCEDGVVTDVRWAYTEGVSGGTIAPVVRLLVPALANLDLSNNGLVGTIPEELYDATNLKRVHLFKNNLEGTISKKIGQLDSITHFHVSHNQLRGTIPEEVKSDGNGIRPLQYFNVYSNQLTGTLPQDMRLRAVIYFDVGRNQLTGTLPDDLGEKFVAARHLYFDHNDFRGTVPASYNTVGNGRLESFAIDNNRLTGTLPGNRDLYNKLVQFTLQGNRFERIDSGNCRMEVPQGEMVEFRADCNVCRCDGFFDLCSIQCYRG